MQSVSSGAISSKPSLMDVSMQEKMLDGSTAQARLTRRRVAASLRARRTRLGRPLTDSDYPAGHPVVAAAQALWGGVAAWSAGAPGRAQRPRGYWRQPAHQVAALRAYAATHPGCPVTAVRLHGAGLHRLATTLTAAQLGDVSSAAGIDRALRQRAAGFWTSEATMDEYASFCRTTGTTLSSHALAGMGSTASNLRTYARRHFASFRLFVEAALARHPDLTVPVRPTSANGVLLDSWSEAAVYNALVRALPGVTIELHVLLPDGRRSCDFVVGGIVHVEVLAIAEADMAAGGSSWKQAYAAKWAAKREIYDAMGANLVTFEPMHVNDPAALAARVAEVVADLGKADALPAVAHHAPGRGTIRAKGTWDLNFLCDAVAALAANLGAFPSYAQLSAAGLGHAACMLRQPGMRLSVAGRIGVPLRHVRGVWTEERVRSELFAWAAAHGEFPTRGMLEADGQAGLARAVRRLFRGRQTALRREVEQRTGPLPPPRRAVAGAYATTDQLAAALQPLCDQLGCFPTCGQMAAAGLPETVYSRVSRGIGVQAMAAHMGVTYAGPRRCTVEEALAEFAVVAAGLPVGRAIDTTLIRRCMGARGIGLLRRLFGSIHTLRAALARQVIPAARDEGEKP